MSAAAASATEIIWTVAALPGLVLWTANSLSAAATVKATRAVPGIAEGPLLWARFSLQLTAVFVGIELVFLILGIVALNRPNNPAATTSTSWLIAGGLILASIGITYLAYRWRMVDIRLVGAAKKHRGPLRS